jgi:glycogen(starch) synthase
MMPPVSLRQSGEENTLYEASVPQTNENGADHSHNGNGTLLRVDVRPPASAPRPPSPPQIPASDKRSLALFCYAAPDSAVGAYVVRLVTALARRQRDVHLFTRHDFDLTLPGVTVQAVGAGDSDELFSSVQEFTSRACNAFLERYPAGHSQVTLFGCEWSSAPVLSLLRGIRNTHTILSLHSLERQRSDMSNELSQQIEEIERNELRESRCVLVHDAGTGEVARQLVPECGRRIVCAREPFAAEPFATGLDAGTVKARYNVGPTDPTLLFIGDLSEPYGPDLLVKAMPAILKNHAQARLIIAGDGALYWPLRVYSRYLLLDHAVRLAGSVEGQAMRELIAAVDVIVLPSREQTPWWPALAGWAAGRPVVATHSAAPALLEHEQDSVLCYPSENSIVWGVEHVLFNPELSQKLIARGHDKLDERFGWGSLAAQVEELMAAPALS